MIEKSRGRTGRNVAFFAVQVGFKPVVNRKCVEMT